jgi:hypothetical protein
MEYCLSVLHSGSEKQLCVDGNINEMSLGIMSERLTKSSVV